MSNEEYIFNFLQNNSLQSSMYKKEFITSIISTNVRNALNYSFRSRTKLVQNKYIR